MPIKIGDQTFMHFEQAVKYVMRTKGLSEERARAYVGYVEQRQAGKPAPRKRRARWRGKQKAPSA
jgi:transposase